jgi:hypothetical protein
MPKKIYTIKGYEDKGKAFRRSTDREYTHAVIIKEQNDNTFVVGYCSRLDLAQKLLNTTLNRFLGNVNAEICETIRIK